MTKPINIKLSDLVRICIAFELSTMEQFRGTRARPEQLLEMADRIMQKQNHTRDHVLCDDGWALASRIYHHILPGMLAICDEAAQHALETPNYFLATEVREKLVGRVFVNDSPGPIRRPR